MKLGVALGFHVHPWEELLGLVRYAEQLGYTAAFVDGDVSMLGESNQADALDGWTVTTALLAHTRKGVTAVYARWDKFGLRREMANVIERSIRETLVGHPEAAVAA